VRVHLNLVDVSLEPSAAADTVRSPINPACVSEPSVPLSDDRQDDGWLAARPNGQPFVNAAVPTAPVTTPHYTARELRLASVLQGRIYQILTMPGGVGFRVVPMMSKV